MSYFPEVIPNTKIVKRVIVADQEFIDSGLVGNPIDWVETFMGHATKRYAGIGKVYDPINKNFNFPNR